MRKRHVYLALLSVNVTVQISARLLYVCVQTQLPLLLLLLSRTDLNSISFSLTVSELLTPLPSSFVPSATVREGCLKAELEILNRVTQSPLSITLCVFLQPPVSMPQSNWPTLNISCSPLRQPPPTSP